MLVETGFGGLRFPGRLATSGMFTILAKAPKPEASDAFFSVFAVSARSL